MAEDDLYSGRRNPSLSRKILALLAINVFGAGLAVAVTATSASAATTPRPAVAHVTPGSGAPTQGAIVTITGTGFTKQARVTFGNVPALHVVVASSKTIRVYAPPHRVGIPVVRVSTSGGTSRAHPAARYVVTEPPPQHRFGTPTTTGTSGSATGLSCPEENFCALTDDQGDVATYDGSTWAPQKHLDALGQLTSVSCPSRHFCAAVDNTGAAATFDGTSWTSPRRIDTHGGLPSVSCPSYVFCTAVDSAGYAVQWNGSSWGSPKRIAHDALAAVSCTGATFCMATGRHGVWVRWTGTWRPPSHLRDGRNYHLVSCVNSRFCAIAADDLGVRIWTGAAWSTIDALDYEDDHGMSIYGLSCVTARRCNVSMVNAQGFDLTVDGAAQTTQRAGGIYGLGMVSCWGTGGCVTARDQQSQRIQGVLRRVPPEPVKTTVTGPITVTGPKWVPEVDRPLDISCPSAHFCAEIDILGFAAVAKDGDWQQPTPVVVGPEDISCTSPTFCLVLAYDGATSVFDGTRWSHEHEVADTHFWDAVSCASRAMCMAISYEGYAARYVDGRFAGSTRIQPKGATSGLADISCPTATTCWASTTGGSVIRYSNGSWAAPVQIDDRPYGYHDLEAISCPTTTFCAVTTQHGFRVLRNGTWSAPLGEAIAGSNYSSPSTVMTCTSASFCVGGSRDGGYGVYNGTDVLAQTFPPAPGNAAPDAGSCWSAGNCEFLGAQPNVDEPWSFGWQSRPSS